MKVMKVCLSIIIIFHESNNLVTKLLEFSIKFLSMSISGGFKIFQYFENIFFIFLFLVFKRMLSS